MSTDPEFSTLLAGALRSPWRLRAAAVKQALRQQVLRHQIRASATGAPTLLVYQMGKVGSTNLQRDLHTQDPALTVFQVHRMHSPYIKALYRRYRANAQAPYYFSNYVGRDIYKRIIAPQEGPEVRILCAVREPISRNLSHFFQDIERFIPRRAPPVTEAEVQQLFIKRFEHDYPQDWFDAEFRAVTGIDVLGAGFDKEAGVMRYQNGRISALIYRIESTNSPAFIDAFRDYTGLNYPKTAQHNLGHRKTYGALYQRVKAVKLPSEFCTEHHQTRYARCFYTEDALAKARQTLSGVAS